MSTESFPKYDIMLFLLAFVCTLCDLQYARDAIVVVLQLL